MIFRGYIDVLVRGTEIILKHTRGSLQGTYNVEPSQREGYRYLSFRPYVGGDINIASGKNNSRFRLTRELLGYLGLAKKDDAKIMGMGNYFELWKLSDLKEHIEANPFTEEDAITLSHLSQHYNNPPARSGRRFPNF